MIHPSIDMIAIVAPVLEKMGEDALFVGGSVVPLYVPEYLWSWVRPTNDVDVVVEVASHRGFAQLERRLETAGLKHDMRPGAPICRWQYREVTIDIMPDDEAVLGFSNQWYKEGRAHAEKREIGPGVFIHILPRAFFLASKIDAFCSRGRNDFLGSSDIEDIVCVLDGCNHAALTEMLQSPKAVLSHVRTRLSEFQQHPAFLDSINGHIELGATHDDRVKGVIQRVNNLSNPDVLQ